MEENDAGVVVDAESFCDAANLSVLGTESFCDLLSLTAHYVTISS